MRNFRKYLELRPAHNKCCMCFSATAWTGKSYYHHFKEELVQAQGSKVNQSRSKAGKLQIGSPTCWTLKPVFAFPTEPWCLLEALNTLLGIMKSWRLSARAFPCGSETFPAPRVSPLSAPVHVSTCVCAHTSVVFALSIHSEQLHLSQKVHCQVCSEHSCPLPL